MKWNTANGAKVRTDLSTHSTLWKVAVVKIGLHVLLTMQVGSNTPRRLESAYSASSALSTERKDMNTSSIERSFERIGARVRISNGERERRRAGIDIGTDKHGEFFDIRIGEGEQVEYEVLNIRPLMKHLLLMARREFSKSKFLCGHDERHWFVSAVPGDSVRDVKDALEALQPLEVRRTVHQRVKRLKNRLKRRNRAFVRQGEWFFVPEPLLTVDTNLVRKNEPITRGRGGKPHMCEYLYHAGGGTEWVSEYLSQGVSHETYSFFLKTYKDAVNWNWRPRMRMSTPYVRGRISHPDHSTIVLQDWHRVVVNTEYGAPWAHSVVYLD